MTAIQHINLIAYQLESTSAPRYVSAGTVDDLEDAQFCAENYTMKALVFMYRAALRLKTEDARLWRRAITIQDERVGDLGRPLGVEPTTYQICGWYADRNALDAKLDKVFGLGCWRRTDLLMIRVANGPWSDTDWNVRYFATGRCFVYDTTIE